MKKSKRHKSFKEAMKAVFEKHGDLLNDLRILEEIEKRKRKKYYLCG